MYVYMRMYNNDFTLHIREHRSISAIIIQSRSCLQLFATPWTAACQASLSFTISRSCLRLMSIESVMLCNHTLRLCIFALQFCSSFQNQNPNSKEHCNSLICFIAMWMLLFCNNLLTEFPLWALAAPILAFGPRSYYLCKSCRDGFRGQSGELTSLQWSCSCCCHAESPLPPRAWLLLLLLQAQSSLPVLAELPPKPTAAHCGSRDHSSPASL